MDACRADRVANARTLAVQAAARWGLLKNSSATKIQKIWRGFKTRKVIHQTLNISLKRATLRKYQKANLIRSRCFTSPSFYNTMPFWLDDPSFKTLPRVCFNDDCYTQTIGEKVENTSQTDFRVRGQKPMNIAVKIINCSVKGKPFSQFLWRYSDKDLLEIDAIFTKATKSLKEKGKFRFSDPHGTSITRGMSDILEQTHAIIKIHTPTHIYCSTRSIPTAQFMDIEYPAALKPINSFKRLTLARTGPTRIAGVPITRLKIDHEDDIEVRLNRLLSNSC
jgi:hypothetical protein